MLIPYLTAPNVYAPNISGGNRKHLTYHQTTPQNIAVHQEKQFIIREEMEFIGLYTFYYWEASSLTELTDGLLKIQRSAVKRWHSVYEMGIAIQNMLWDSTQSVMPFFQLPAYMGLKVGLGVALLTIKSNKPLLEFLLLIPTHLASADFVHGLTSQGRNASTRRHHCRMCWVRSTECHLAVSGLCVPGLAETSWGNGFWSSSQWNFDFYYEMTSVNKIWTWEDFPGAHLITSLPICTS